MKNVSLLLLKNQRDFLANRILYNPACHRESQNSSHVLAELYWSRPSSINACPLRGGEAVGEISFEFRMQL